MLFVEIERGFWRVVERVCDGERLVNRFDIEIRRNNFWCFMDFMIL